MKKICGIYKITSPSKRVYIGQSLDILTRWKRYKLLDCKKQQRLYRSIKKYGFNRHIFEIIHECDPKELNDLEKYYVDLFCCFNSEFGLNLQDGGGAAGAASEATKLKMSISHSGENNHFFGKSHSPEQKAHWTLIRTGRKLSPETIAKLTGIKQSPETCEKKRQKMLGRVSPMKGRRQTKRCIEIVSKPILQIAINGELIKEWPSAKAISQELGFGAGYISACAKGRREIYKNFIWKFKPKL